MRTLNSKEKNLFERIKENAVLQVFFFRKAKGLHWFQPLSDAGFFKSDQNPRPIINKETSSVSVSPWASLEYLVSTAKEIKESKNEKYAILFRNIIRDITNYAKINSFSNYHTWHQLSEVIKEIPCHLLEVEDIDCIDYWLEDPYDTNLVANEIGGGWLFQLLNENEATSNEIAYKLIEILFVVRILGEKNKEAKLRIDGYYARKIIKKCGLLSGKVLNIRILDFIKITLMNIFEKCNNDKLLIIWRNAIEDNDDGQYVDHKKAENILISYYRDSLLGCLNANFEETKKHLSMMFNSDYVTFPRIAYYIVDESFDELAEMIPDIISTKSFNSYNRHELWNLLNNHFNDFDSAVKTKVIDIIKDFKIIDDEGNVKLEQTVYHRAGWLSAFKDQDKTSLDLYNEYIEVTGKEPEHPNYSTYFTVGRNKNTSPYSLLELNNFTIEKLVEKLNSYQDPNKFEGPDLGGLLEVFKEFVKSKVNNSGFKLIEFNEVNLPFIDTIINVYSDLWKEGRALLWDEIWDSLLDWFSEIIERNDFWISIDPNSEDRLIPYNERIVSSISRFIAAGVASDKTAFSKRLLPKAKKVILALLEKQSGDKIKGEVDLVSFAINSPRGHCIEALINLTLRECRLQKNVEEEHKLIWADYEASYEKFFFDDDRSTDYEFTVLFMNYFGNFNYMSTDWTFKVLDRIFYKEDYQNWLCAINGFGFIGTFNFKLYLFMMENGHLAALLEDNKVTEYIKSRAVNFGTIAYFNHDDDQLMMYLLKRNNCNEIREIINYVRREADNYEKVQKKLIYLWGQLLDVIDTKSQEGRELMSSLCNWSEFIDSIDDHNMLLLLKVAPYAYVNHSADIMMKSLAKISENQAKEVQKIWLSMLDNVRYAYSDEAIEEIFGNLLVFGSDGEVLANDVADAYIQKGIDQPSIILKELKKKLCKLKQ